MSAPTIDTVLQPFSDCTSMILTQNNSDYRHTQHSTTKRALKTDSQEKCGVELVLTGRMCKHLILSKHYDNGK